MKHFVVLLFFTALFLSPLMALDDQKNLAPKDLDNLDWDNYLEKGFLSVTQMKGGQGKKSKLLISFRTSFYNMFKWDNLPQEGSNLEKWEQFKKNWENNKNWIKTSSGMGCDESKTQRSIRTNDQSDWFELVSLSPCHDQLVGQSLEMLLLDDYNQFKEIEVTIDLPQNQTRYEFLEKGNKLIKF